MDDRCTTGRRHASNMRPRARVYSANRLGAVSLGRLHHPPARPFEPFHQFRASRLVWAGKGRSGPRTFASLIRAHTSPLTCIFTTTQPYTRTTTCNAASSHLAPPNRAPPAPKPLTTKIPCRADDPRCTHARLSHAPRLHRPIPTPPIPHCAVPICANALERGEEAAPGRHEADDRCCFEEVVAKDSRLSASSSH